MSTRDKLDHLHQQILGEIDRLESRLEAVASQVNGAMGQFQRDRAAAESAMNAIANKLVTATNALKDERAAGPKNFVNLSPEGRAVVSGLVAQVLDKWQPRLDEVINSAENSVLAGIGEVKTAVKEGAKQQSELLQQQAQQGVFNWPRFGAYLAGCVASAVISGSVVAWAFI